MGKKEKKRLRKIEKEYQKLDIFERRVAVANEMSKMIDGDGKPFFSVEWIKEKILKIEDND